MNREQVLLKRLNAIDSAITQVRLVAHSRLFTFDERTEVLNGLRELQSRISKELTEITQ